MSTNYKVNSVFEEPWWLDIVAKNCWHEVIIKNKNGEHIARLVYADQKIYGVKYCGVPPMTQQLGPSIKLLPDGKLSTRLLHIKQVLEGFIEFLSKKGNVDLYFHRNLQYILPFIWHGYSVEPKFSYVIKSLSDLNKVFSNMDAKVRNLIKTAEKNVKVSNNICIDELIFLLENTFKRQNRKLPMDVEVIREIYQESIKRNAGKVLGAIDLKTGQIVSVAFFLYDENTCYYLLGGKNYSSSLKGTQELLLWEGIKIAATVSKEFDFEGSMIPGIESFFRGFGGEPCVYYRVKKGNMIFSFLHWIKPIVKKFLNYK